MNILTVGDSFTYGDELENRNNAWPIILKNRLQCEVENVGVSGSGNTRMVRTVINNIDKFDVFIIAWSHFGRIEFSDSDGTFDTWPGNGSGYHCTPPASYRAGIIDYCNKHYNDEYLYTQYLLNIILTQRYLEAHNKKYIMLNAFGNNMNRNSWPELTQLTSQINSKYFVGWPSLTMMEWTIGIERGPRGHFLDEGHAIIAGIIYEHIRLLDWA